MTRDKSESFEVHVTYDIQEFVLGNFIYRGHYSNMIHKNAKLKQTTCTNEII